MDVQGEEEHAKENQTVFQQYLVVFFDILDQRHSLREIKDLPNPETGLEEFIEPVRRTFGRVRGLRSAFQQFFDGIQAHIPDLSSVAPEHHEEFLALQKSEAYYYGFSDTIIVCVPLAGDDEDCTAMNGVFAALLATAVLSLVALSQRVPMRGGADVGIAAQIDEEEAYGPALERAHSLESCLAEYPRVLVGDELLTNLHTVQDQQCSTRSGEMAKRLASLCLAMIVQDTDGRFMLDFMGQRVKDAAQEALNSELVKSAFEFVASQHQTFQGRADQKLTPRYFRLMRYMRSRLSLWGLEEGETTP